VTRRYVRQRIKPNAARWFEAGDLPVRELAKGLGELGVLGMHLHGYGCAGANAVSYGLACSNSRRATPVSDHSCLFKGRLPCSRFACLLASDP